MVDILGHDHCVHPASIITDVEVQLEQPLRLSRAQV